MPFYVHDRDMSGALDKHITGNYGEDKYMGECPNCGVYIDMTEFECSKCGYKFEEGE